MVFQIPGGWLALRVGGARLFGSAVLVASILTLLTPAAARWSPAALILVRILEGLVLVSSLHSTLKPVLSTEEISCSGTVVSTSAGLNSSPGHGHCVVLSWARHFTLTVPLSTQV